ncbi:MAG: peptidylprolyl isomerase [Phycisphaerales bacterium]|nr:peptidylprolyl isomerase [Phycisphaerales bacterium]MCB9837416.1 peptidylprolyl isomerase [Phycisphaera sp.]
MNPFRKAGPRAEKSTPRSKQPQPLFDELEQRLLLSVFFGEDFPDLADMENMNNIIVRFNMNVMTDMGRSYFDLELFVSEDDDPVGTVANFVDYVQRGQYDGMFFQRLQNLNANSDEPPEILQGGRNRIDDDSGTVTVIDVGDAIDDEVVRENDARTIAMAKTSAPNSATSQFFINLTDNETELSPDVQPNGGFPVFGRVLDDESWDLLMTIASLDVEDLQTRLIDPQFGGNAFPSVPVTDAFVNDPMVRFTDEMFVTVLDAEVIKAEGVNSFFDQAVYLPEGYRNFRSNEILTVVNTNDEEAAYQVILRYATTEDRDYVIASGVLDAGERREIILSGMGATAEVVGFIPYAIEVQTASEDATSRPVSATLRRSDFEGDSSITDTFAGENFFNPEAIAEADRFDTLTTWVFADGERSENVDTYITWMNLTADEGEVMIEFFFEDGSSTELVNARELGMYRRGGVNVKGIGTSVLPEGVFSARVTSTVPIVASMTMFRTDVEQGQISGAALSLGQAGGGGPIAGIADIRNPDGSDGRVAVVNLGATEAVVRFDFIDDFGTIRSSVFNSVNAGARRTFDLSAMPGMTLPMTQIYSLRISVQDGGPDIAAQYTTAGALGEGEAILATGGRTHVFADAMSSDDSGYEESISIYNPNDLSANFTFLVHFSDGTRFSVMRTLAAGRRTDIDLSNDLTSDLTAIRNKIDSADEFANYSVTVTSTRLTLASITRIDGGFLTTATGTVLAGLAAIG